MPSFGDVRPMVAKINLLITTRVAIMLSQERCGVTKTDLGKQVYERVHRLRRQQLPMGTAVTLLATSLAFDFCPDFLLGRAPRQPAPGPSLDGGRCELFEF